VQLRVEPACEHMLLTDCAAFVVPRLASLDISQHLLAPSPLLAMALCVLASIDPESQRFPQLGPCGSREKKTGS
jgi:hypothetical protein